MTRNLKDENGLYAPRAVPTGCHPGNIYLNVFGVSIGKAEV